MLKSSLILTTFAASTVSLALNYSQPASAQTQQLPVSESDCGSENIVVCDDGLIHIAYIPDEASCNTSNIYWNHNEFDEVPGIYQASLYQHCNKDNTISFWLDQRPSGHSSQTQLDDNGALTVKGELRMDRSICYEIVASGPDEKTVTINDSTFNTKAGGLFLISTENNDLEVKQVKHDLTRISAYDIRLMAVRIPEITSFFLQQSSIPGTDSLSDSRDTEQPQCGTDHSKGMPFYTGSLREQ